MPQSVPHGRAGSGRIFVFEGASACGKTTQIALAQAWLATLGYTVEVLRPTDATPWTKALEEVRLQKLHRQTLSDLLIQLAIRNEYRANFQNRLIDQDYILLVDRDVLSLLVYQVLFSDNITMQHFQDLRATLETIQSPFLLPPTHTLLFEVESPLLVERFARRNRPEKSYTLTQELADQSSAAFRTAASSLPPQSISIISGNESPEMVAQNVKQILTTFLPVTQTETYK